MDRLWNNFGIIVHGMFEWNKNGICYDERSSNRCRLYI